MIPGRILRFALVGAVNTGVYYGLYLALHQALPYLAAHVLAFCLAMIGSYFLNCHFTFRTKPTLKKFLLFPLSNAANFAITSLGLYLLVDLGGLNSTIAPLLVAVLAIPVTFVVSQLVLVGKEKAAAR